MPVTKQLIEVIQQIAVAKPITDRLIPVTDSGTSGYLKEVAICL